MNYGSDLLSHFIRIYTFLQILSIDVVLGGLASGAMAAKILEVNMPRIWWLALPISIWVIYTADHLMDAYRLKDQAHTPRHLFHHQHFKPILFIWLLMFGSCISWIAWLVPVDMLFLAFCMGGLVLMHLGLVKLIGNKVSWLFHKELGVGGIYAAGVWGGPAVLAWEKIGILEVEMFIQFLILALINLLIFSMYEMETDQKDGHTSFVRAIGVRNTKILIISMSICLCILGLHSLIGIDGLLYYTVQGVYGGMMIVFLILSFFEHRFKKYELYRVLGDGAFLLPGLVLFESL